MVIDAFLACLFNVHYLIFLSMVHEYAYFYEYIWKSVYYFVEREGEGKDGYRPTMGLVGQTVLFANSS